MSNEYKFSSNIAIEKSKTKDDIWPVSWKRHTRKKRIEDNSDAMEKIWDSVVKISCCVTKPCLERPWTTCESTQTRSTGFFIEGRKIMCNAHCVTWATTIWVRKRSSSRKYGAKVFMISHECDLAVLEVDNDNFWKNTHPIQLGNNRVHQLSEVVVIGYPMGGSGISLTKGVVSRIGMMTYSHGDGYLPFIQTDAAINRGNSGGPALQYGKVIGVAFSGLSKANNIGYLIPVQVVKFFLHDVYSEAAEFRGFGEIPFTFSKCENPSWRQFFELPSTKTGVVIREVPWLSSAYKKLKFGDVLRKIEKHVVGNDGKITLGFHNMPKQQVSLDWVIALSTPGKNLRFSILRKGKAMDLDIEVGKMDNYNRYFPWYQYDVPPTYYIWAGLTFIHYTAEVKKLFSKQDIPMSSDPMSNNRKVVVCPTILDHPVNQSYRRRLFRVRYVNGIDVNSVRDVMKIIESIEPDDFVRLAEEHSNEVGVLMIIKKSAGDAAEKQIKKRYGIISMKSADLLQSDETWSSAAVELYYKELNQLAEDFLCVETTQEECGWQLHTLHAQALSYAEKLEPNYQGDGNFQSLIVKLKEMKNILGRETDL